MLVVIPPEVEELRRRRRCQQRRAAAPSHAPERTHAARLVSLASESAVVGVGPKAPAPHREKAGVSRGHLEHLGSRTGGVRELN